MTKPKKLDIKPCPLCGNQHFYEEDQAMCKGNKVERVSSATPTTERTPDLPKTSPPEAGQE